MSRIEVPADVILQKATKSLVNDCSSEHYKKIAEQANKRIQEERLKRAEAVIHASGYVAL